MRSLKKPKPKTPTILQQQSQKLKQKLQLLRQQVTQKKQQKQMNKTATSMQSNRPFSKTQQNKLSTTQVNMQPVDVRLRNVLTEMKLQSLEDKLKEKGVKSFERMVQLTEEEIDQWKDVAVGWRIKLKKGVRMAREDNKEANNATSTSGRGKEQTANTLNSVPSSITQPLLNNRDQKDIQAIIRQRKQDKVFVVMSREIQQVNQQQEDYWGEQAMPDQDQDVIIQSFMKVFQPRKGILYQKRGSRNVSGGRMMGVKKRVGWSRDVEEMEQQFMRKNHKTYPKETIVKQALISMHDQQRVDGHVRQYVKRNEGEHGDKYCWQCFKRVQSRVNNGFTHNTVNGTKHFCSERCQQVYSEEIECYGVNQDQYQDQKRQQNVVSHTCGKLIQQNEEEDIETIDLSIS